MLVNFCYEYVSEVREEEEEEEQIIMEKKTNFHNFSKDKFSKLP